MSANNGPQPPDRVTLPEATTDGAGGELPAFLLEQLRGIRRSLTLRMPLKRSGSRQPTVSEEQGNEERVA